MNENERQTQETNDEKKERKTCRIVEQDVRCCLTLILAKIVSLETSIDRGRRKNFIQFFPSSDRTKETKKEKREKKMSQ